MHWHTLKPRYNEQVRQTLFVHYIEYFTISNVICLVSPQNGIRVLLTMSQNSLYRGLSVFGLEDPLVLNVILSEPTNQKIYNSICIFLL